MGMSPEEVALELTSKIEEKQNRYKWRKKILEIAVTSEDTRCKYTGNFLEDMGL